MGAVMQPSEHRFERRASHLVVDLAPMKDATDVSDLFAGLAKAVTSALRADACLVSLMSDDRRFLRDVAAHVIPPAKLDAYAEQYLVDEFPATKDILISRGHIEISLFDLQTDPQERHLLERLGFARLLMCGFSIEDEVLGTVEVYRTGDRPFRNDDHEQVDLLVAFAASAYSKIQLATKLESHYTETIEALTSALEARDPSTEAHTGRIRDLAMALSTALKVPPEIRNAVHLGALLHDVGKIGISDAILRKPGPLTDEEWAVMRLHPEIGEQMLKRVDFLAPALPVVRHHHERWDGSGYPDRLSADEIPLAARIVSVCDAYDAMTSDRPYRPARAPDDACKEIQSESGRQFDPTCATLLTDVITNVGQENLEERFIRFAD